MSEPVEQEYMEVLQDLEATITSVYREHRELADHNVENVVNGLLRMYQARLKDRPAPKLVLRGIEVELYDDLKSACDWWIGESQPDDATAKNDSPLTLEEIAICLKRIRKSINFWTASGGRQGYLNYVAQFI